MMNSEGIQTGDFPGKWNIDLNWYTENDCSFLTLARDHLCTKCRKRLKKDTKPEEIIKTIVSCCSKKSDYNRADLPVLTSVFRYFLANGNKPVEISTMAEELAQQRNSPAGAFPQVLYQLLNNEKYYGIKSNSSTP